MLDLPEEIRGHGEPVELPLDVQGAADNVQIGNRLADDLIAIQNRIDRNVDVAGHIDREREGRIRRSMVAS